MKNIKSVLIGFLLATCMFLFLGQSSNDSQIGNYQMTASDNSILDLLDTSTGIYYTKLKGMGKAWKRKSPRTNWIEN